MTSDLVHVETQGALPVAIGTGHAGAAGVERVAGHGDRQVASAVNHRQGEILPGRKHGGKRNRFMCYDSVAERYSFQSGYSK